MKENEKARAWREHYGISRQRLGELTGYSTEAVIAFEQGKSKSRAGPKIKPWVWQRYKMACAGIDAQLRSGLNFDWEG